MSEKVALVTGAARGIGLATTRLFIEQGWRVAMVDRDDEALVEAADGLNHHVHILEMNGESFRLRQSRKAKT